METLGTRICRLRKEKGLTQEDLAKKFNISVQAVSKWENDNSSPDISVLLELSSLLGVTVEYLLGGEYPQQDVKVEVKDIKKLVLRIKVLSKDGDKVNVNLPMPIILIALETGMTLPQINGNDLLKNIDFKEIIKLVEQGVIGELVSIESADGDIVKIVVE